MYTPRHFSLVSDHKPCHISSIFNNVQWSPHTTPILIAAKHMCPLCPNSFKPFVVRGQLRFPMAFTSVLHNSLLSDTPGSQTHRPVFICTSNAYYFAGHFTVDVLAAPLPFRKDVWASQDVDHVSCRVRNSYDSYQFSMLIETLPRVRSLKR